MQEIQPLVDSILEEARREAEELREQGRTAAEEVKAKYQARSEELYQELLSQAEKRAKETKEREKIQAQLGTRRELLEMKGEFIERVFKMAESRLSGMDLRSYADFMEGLLLGAVETGTEELLLSGRDRQRLGGEFLNRINNKLRSSGKKGALVYSKETPEVSGGFILRRGKILHNYTIENLVASKKEELTPEIAKKLFD